MTTYSVSILGESVADFTSRTDAATNAKALAAARGFSVITTVLQAGANPYHVIHFPDGESVFVDYYEDEDLYRGTQKRISKHIKAIRERRALLDTHAFMVEDITDPHCNLDCLNCPVSIRRICVKCDEARTKSRKLGQEIAELYRMKEYLRQLRRARP